MIKDLNKKISIGTTFNKRIFEQRSNELASNVFHEMQKKYSEIPFFVYHENSFELKNYNQKIDFEGFDREKLFLYDVFDINGDWVYDFILNSPLKDCHKIKNDKWLGHHSNDYWNRNAIYWFRKIAAIHHCIKQVNTDYLIWLGADVMFGKEFDEKLLNFIEPYDASLVIRPGKGIESDVCFFNLNRGGREVIDEWVDMFLSHRIFKESRWDDSWALEKTRQNLNNEYSFGDLNKISIYDYVNHHKGTNITIRKEQRGI